LNMGEGKGGGKGMREKENEEGNMGLRE